MRNKILNIILLLFAFSSIYSQNYNIQHYTVKDGLLHSFVNDIVQDNRGNIWVATGGGLCMFNGVEFKNYTTKNGLNYPRLLSIAVDNKNNIWVGTLVGLNVFNGDSIYALKSKNGNEKILAIAKSQDGKMWISSNKGIKKIEFNNGKFKTKKINYNFGDNQDVNIFQDTKWNNFLIETTDNKLFIGLNSQVYLYQQNKVSEININDSTEIYSACELANNKIIFGTNSGLYTYSDNKFNKIKNKNLQNFKVLKIKQKNGTIWMIGKWSNKSNELFLVSINLNNKKYYRKISVSNGLINNPTSLYIDHENNIWTGSNGGLNVLKGESFVTYTTKNGLIGNKIWGIYNNNNNIWVGTINQGLSIILKDTILKFNIKDGLPDKYIGAINKYHDNVIFLGTARKGLCTAELDTVNYTVKFNRLKIPLNKDKTRIDDIIKDKNNIFWIGSNKGLYYSHNGKTFYHKKLFANDTNQVFVQKILQASNGKLYIGTKQNGLFILDKNKITNLFNNTNLHLGIISICEDSEGKLWVASQHKGITNINNKNNKWITDKNGLKSNLVYILQSDKNGNIWVGTNLGLDKINVKEYNKSGKIIVRHYGINDGLQTLEMNLNGSFEDKNQNLWFATNNGLLKYDYRYDISNRIPPIISLLSVKLHSKTVDWTKYCDSLITWNKLPLNPVLPYNKNHITFEFIGISYKNPKEIRYSWKLEGFDKKWVPSSYNRQVIYSNLPPGNYVFKLKSSNNDGVWNKKILEFKFAITPPFWITWWFITLAILTIIFGFYLFMRFRLRTLQKRQIELQKIVLERTKEIFKQKEEIKQQRDTVYEQKQKIEQIHFRLSDSIDYAKRIQNSILPNDTILKNTFLDYFLIFKPKDKVSGDFYWWTQINEFTIIAAADCTGHGVPGAFMSMLGISFLREIVEKEKITQPGLILDLLRKNIIEALNQTGDYNEPKDGMDIAIISINHKTNKLQFAGANNPLYIIKPVIADEQSEHSNLSKNNSSCILAMTNNELGLYEVKPDRMPISIYVKMKNFTTREINLQTGNYIYLFSDGFADQFGIKNKKKFGYKRFKQLLLENTNKPMSEQKRILLKTLNEWKGTNEQIDDIIIMGIRI